MDADASVPPRDGTTGAGTGGGGTAGSAPPMRSSGCDATDVPADGLQQIDVDGTPREFITAVPDDYDPGKPYALIFAWHAERETAEQIAGELGYYGLQSMAGGRAIFVAGQGLDTQLGAVHGPGWDDLGGRDVAFARAMLDFVRSRYCIDEQRIFSVGMGYGGVMTNAVACALGEHVRAIAVMSGIWPSTAGTTDCAGPVAAWLSHGTADVVATLSAGQASRDHWVDANHCKRTTAPADENGCTAYEGCDEGYPVTWCEFDGDHTVPPFAGAAIWAFFSQF